MLITIDASRLLTNKPTGVELYCQEIIKGLLTKDNNLVLYTPQLITFLPADNQHILNWPFKKAWSQLRLGLELLTNPPDVFFSPGYVIPWLALFNKKIKKIVTIHDVAFIYLTDSYSWWQRWFLTITTRQAVKFAYKINVPTQTTADDLIKHFNCPANKIKVTYFGYEQRRVPVNLPLTRQKQVLYIGRIEDKKNINNLIMAFKLFYRLHSDYKLVLAGKPGVGYKNIESLIHKYKFVDYRGYITDKEKKNLLQTSSVLVLLSKYEGFGFPLLEAFNYQLPVLASNIPVLREIGQSACLFVRPDSLSEIAKKIKSIIINKELRQQLIQAGQRRAHFFNWSHCLGQTWQIFNS